MTRGEEIFTRTNAAIEEGKDRPVVFRELAEEYSITADAVRGAYYTWKKRVESGGTAAPRGRRRDTSPADVLADARAALERGMEAIDREVQQAAERATEAAAEHKALKEGAAAKKQEIAKRLEALS